MYKGTFMTVMQLGLLAVVPFAIMNGTLVLWALALFMYFVYAGLGTVVVMHRLLAHRTFEAPLWFRRFGSFMATVGSLLTPLEWVQQHMDHHRYVDTDKDPHSPMILGWKALFFCFHKQGTGKIAVARLAKETWMKNLHVYFYQILVLYILALFLVGGVNLVVFAWAIPCLMALWGQILIVFAHDKNGVKDSGWFVALTTFGENNHTRHHEDPRDITQDGIAYKVIQFIRKDK